MTTSTLLKANFPQPIFFFSLSSAGDSAASSSHTSLQLRGNAMRVKLSSVITEVLNTQQEAIKSDSQFQDECLNQQVAKQTADFFRIYLFLASSILSAITDMICSHSNWIWLVREFEHERAISHILEQSFVETLNIYFCPAITNYSVLMDIPCFQVIKA